MSSQLIPDCQVETINQGVMTCGELTPDNNIYIEGNSGNFLSEIVACQVS